MVSLASFLAVAAGLVGAVVGDYFPPSPEGLTVVESQHHEGVKISYKEVCSIQRRFMLSSDAYSPESAKQRQGSSRIQATCICRLAP